MDDRHPAKHRSLPLIFSAPRGDSLFSDQNAMVIANFPHYLLQSPQEGSFSSTRSFMQPKTGAVSAVRDRPGQMSNSVSRSPSARTEAALRGRHTEPHWKPWRLREQDAAPAHAGRPARRAASII